jgi:ABC-type molybdenum transport system ATPase subunit/photorepair protein PhrA
VNHASPGAAALAVELIRAGLTRGGRQVLADISWRMTSG